MNEPTKRSNDLTTIKWSNTENLWERNGCGCASIGYRDIIIEFIAQSARMNLFLSRCTELVMLPMQQFIKQNTNTNTSSTYSEGYRETISNCVDCYAYMQSMLSLFSFAYFLRYVLMPFYILFAAVWNHRFIIICM